MPDWLTHSLVGWITGKTIKQDIALVVVGALIPDLVKIDLLFTWLLGGSSYFFEPLHTPIGALLVACIITLFFNNYRNTFIAFTIGIITHFILDFFLVQVHGGIKLFFPFSWEGWQYHLIRSDDYRLTIIAIFTAFLVFSVYWYYKKLIKSIPQ